MQQEGQCIYITKIPSKFISFLFRTEQHAVPLLRKGTSRCFSLEGRTSSSTFKSCFLSFLDRFEDAVTASRQAARLDPSREEVNAVARKARAVAAARLSGNLLFNASKFEVACVVYTEGLEQDPFNALLLCNRAASRFKLGLFEKAIEDCTLALNLQPSYRKARRRRADSNAKVF